MLPPMNFFRDLFNPVKSTVALVGIMPKCMTKRNSCRDAPNMLLFHSTVSAALPVPPAQRPVPLYGA
jgi:hypothetical protein